jgi:hypothetical protein
VSASFLFKPKAELEVQTKETCLPGATLPVRVTVCLQEQVKLRQLRLELVGQETYYVQETTTDYKGRRETDTVQRVDTFARVSRVVMEQPSLLTPGVEAGREVSLQVPLDAPPTCQGKVVDVCWRLRAILDIPGRPDQMREMPLQVVSVAPTQAAWYKEGKALLQAEKSFEDCALTLEVPAVLAAREVVRGRLLVRAKRHFEVRGVRVELARLEDAGARRAYYAVAHQDLSGPISLNPTDSPTFDFSLPLPQDVAPTMVLPHSSLLWHVRAVLDRRLRGDFNIQQDVFVYNAPEPSRE